jgi:SpoVK/Ycf46/Vps4 family AAA+-type ATPase
MIVYATNRPDIIDSAILSRVTRAIEIGPPSLMCVEAMLEQYTRSVLKQIDTSSLDLKEIARKLHDSGAVGRDVMNLTISLQQAVFGSDNFALSPMMVNECVDEIRKKRASFSHD